MQYIILNIILYIYKKKRVVGSRKKIVQITALILQSLGKFEATVKEELSTGLKGILINILL